MVSSHRRGSVNCPASDGFFGILPGHAPLLTNLGDWRAELSRWRHHSIIAAVFGGYAEVLADRVIVLAEAAERAEEINVDRARAAKQEAEKILATQGISPEEQDGARIGCFVRAGLTIASRGARGRRSPRGARLLTH